MIRPLEEKDIDRIVFDEERIFGDSLGAAMIGASLDGSDPLNHYFVSEDDGKYIGYIGIWIDGVNAQILNFYVVEDERRKHRGEEMVRFIIDYAHNNGVTTISLEVREHNYNAIDLYKKIGFEYSYKRKYYYNDGEDAHVYMLRSD